MLDAGQQQVVDELWERQTAPPDFAITFTTIPSQISIPSLDGNPISLHIMKYNNGHLHSTNPS